MKVLLLHAHDKFPLAVSPCQWDLVVDFGRAPRSTYEEWSHQAGCRVLGLHELAEEIGDLFRVKEFVQAGLGQVIDEDGIDWWNALSAMLWPDLLDRLLLTRLAREVGASCELYMSRPIPGAADLAAMSGVQPVSLRTHAGSIFDRVRRPLVAMSQLDNAQLLQVLLDKFDGSHAIRRRLSPRGSGSREAAVLLPSAYISVSRTAVSYAELLPDTRFLLVYARGVGRLKAVPPNVHTVSLDGYFCAPDENEMAGLLRSADALKETVIPAAAEFLAVSADRILDQFHTNLRWGIAVRDAWKNLMRSEKISACLCADDGNPYTLLPLLLARRRGLPTVACHHGALDLTTIIKKQLADFYLVKTGMEWDYLVNVCRVSPETLVAAPPVAERILQPAAEEVAAKPWLVFFTEGYRSPWRDDEIYRELIPSLVALSQATGLKLVFKLHPFDSMRDFRGLLRRHLTADMNRRVELIDGPPSDELWRNTQFALTVHSTVALECKQRDIPIFLCGWLRNSYGAYVEQYARFGIGCLLSSPEQIAEIPRLIEADLIGNSAEGDPWPAVQPDVLRAMLQGTCSSSSRVQANFEAAGG